ncbi:MAG: hypothetical protein M1160_03090 [Candidatus Marsarchaeota archaeon]|nr:hypothetical protein [Candidatus Marsarchaeota archaeon]MCL5111836.1 hypothetical protein [Candidatus Marsarchaeota archaeon]
MDLITMEHTRPETGGASSRRAEQHLVSTHKIVFRTKEDNRRGIDAAAELGRVTQRKVGNLRVTLVNEEQIEMLDHLKVKYEHYIPPRSDSQQGYA